MGRLKEAVVVTFETPDGTKVKEFEQHSLSTGWICGYDAEGQLQKKIPRNRVWEVDPK